MSTTTATYGTLSLEEAFAADEGDRRSARIRRDLGVQSFNINAIRAVGGEELLREHDEVGPAADGHERVWVVLSGHAVFTVDGEEIDAPAGTVVHVPAPSAKRSAIAKEAGTTLLGIGGRVGAAYRETPGEAIAAFFPLHEAGEYEEAAAVCREALERNPENALALFNLACCEALLGRADDALAHLGEAVALAPSLRENAASDTDLDPLRADPRFEALATAATG
jgi:tetratricopeptide (TPR) repeat protein